MAKRRIATFLRSVTILLLLANVLGQMELETRDCACSCCDGDSCGREQLILTGGPDKCTPETCLSRSQACSEGEGEVRATYFDCLCGCCRDSSCESSHLFHYDAEGERDRCNEVGCWARSDLCLDPGSHQGSVIQVSFAERNSSSVLDEEGSSSGSSGSFSPGIIILIVFVCVGVVTLGIVIASRWKKDKGRFFIEEKVNSSEADGDSPISVGKGKFVTV